MRSNIFNQTTWVSLCWSNYISDVYTSLFVTLEASKWAFHLAVEWKVRMSDGSDDFSTTDSKVEKLAPIMLVLLSKWKTKVYKSLCRNCCYEWMLCRTLYRV